MKRKIKTALIYILLITLILLMLGGVVNIFMLAWAQKFILPHTSLDTLPEGFTPDCIVVLGAKVADDETVSLILADRLDVGMQVYEKYDKKVPLLMSGGDTPGENEINAMTVYATSGGVQEDSILKDGGGVNTYASIRRARDIFGAKKMIIVTQDFHMARSVYIARSLGVEAYGVTSDLRIYFRSNHVREFFARIKEVFNVMLNA